MIPNVKESTSLTVWLHRILDATLPSLTLYISSQLYNNAWSDKYLLLGILGGLLLVVFSQGIGIYSHWQGKTLFAGFKLVMQAWVFTWLALLAIAFLLKDSSHFSRVIITIWAISTPATLFISRFALRYLLGYFRTTGWNSTRIIIIGAGDLGQRLAKTLLDAKMLGYHPIAFFDDSPKIIGKFIKTVPVMGSIDDFLKIKDYSELCDEVYITLPLRAETRIKEVLNNLTNTTLTVKYAPDFFTFDLIHSRLSDIAGIPIFSVYDTPLNSKANIILKRMEDISLSVLILILISPLLIMISIGIKLTSKGPILFKQSRISWNGKSFTMYKFRSMPTDTDSADKHRWGGAKEKTNTNFGRFLRKTSLDELPQFFNTLIGNMSIVGPRPEQDIFVEQFRSQIPRYMRKHTVKAGITGWAQINGWRGDTSLEKRIEFDIYYIDNWSVWLDFKIILLTVVKGFINKNAY